MANVRNTNRLRKICKGINSLIKILIPLNKSFEHAQLFPLRCSLSRLAFFSPCSSFCEAGFDRVLIYFAAGKNTGNVYLAVCRVVPPVM